MSAAEFPSCNF